MSNGECAGRPSVKRLGRITGVLFVFALLMPVPGVTTGSTSGFPEIVCVPDTLYQGDLMRLEIAFPNGVKGVSGTILGHALHLFPDKDRSNRWVGFIGIDLEDEPGSHNLTIRTDENVFTSKVVIHEKDYGARRLEIQERKMDPETLERIREESELLETLWAHVSAERFWRESFLRPVSGKISGKFGVRTYINGTRRSPHSGVDFRAQKNENILCSNDGKVALVRELYYAGNSVFVDHGLSLYTMYFHLERPLVRQGDWIRRGEAVGKAGSTGRSTGVHLHWGARLNGARIDPLQLLDRSQMSTH